jgi:plasmid stabilization system protein ParE
VGVHGFPRSEGILSGCPRVPPRVPSYRELVEAPWRLIYRAEAERVIVIALLDGRRDLADVLLERLLRD